MIQNVHIQNFKILRDVSVDLERLTVFVGANGSGKTSVLEAIHNAVRAATGDPQKVFAHERHGDWVYSRGGSGHLLIDCLTEGGKLRVEGVPPTDYPPDAELLQKSLWGYKVYPTNIPPFETEPSLSTVLASARKLVFLHLNAAAMARASYSSESPPRMKPSGQGLASVLAFMALNNPSGFAEVVDLARMLIPRLRQIRFRRATVRQTETELVKFGSDTVERQSRRPYQGELILLDFDHAQDISARTASEGTLLVIGLLTVLLGPRRPDIVLLDDIEHGLHPLAQKQLVVTIGSLLQKFPKLQVLTTAHSPYLLNYVAPEQVRLTAAGPDGWARCAKLIDHPKFSTWKEEMSPGEMWTLFGERWVAGESAT